MSISSPQQGRAHSHTQIQSLLHSQIQPPSALHKTAIYLFESLHIPLPLAAGFCPSYSSSMLVKRGSLVLVDNVGILGQEAKGSVLVPAMA